MPATAANTNPEKLSTTAVPTQPAQLGTSPSTGEPSKVRTRSSADTSLQAKQPSKYDDTRKFLSANHLLAESSPCTVLSLANVLATMAGSYRMSENVGKALRHVAEALLHIEQNAQRT